MVVGPSGTEVTPCTRPMSMGICPELRLSTILKTVTRPLATVVCQSSLRWLNQLLLFWFVMTNKAMSVIARHLPT